jgi:DNA-binding helix-hairpin-helix protein with protein kinase domain
VGTPDFIAPEVVMTQDLDRSDPNRKLPNQSTDRHALSVLIDLYLLFRHPLRGRKIHDMDSNLDEAMLMGAAALFIEHPTDKSNRVKAEELHPSALPWGDPDERPCKMAGPHLEALFQRAFVEALHAAEKRPSPSDWEMALSGAHA